MRKDCTQNNVVIDGFDIATWYSKGIESPYMAVNMTIARDRLKGYNLSNAEKTDLCELMAGYCMALEDLRLVGYGGTEFQAISDLFSHAVLKTAKSTIKDENQSELFQ